MAIYILKQIPSTIFIMISASILQGAAEPRAELTISPGSEVLLSTSVNLTCRVKNLRPAHERLQLKFGAGKHTAVLHDSWLGYPTLWGTKRLLPHSCLDFSGPTVTICAGKSQLSARFEAVPGLVGRASCGVMTGESVEKTLQITDIYIWIHPHRPKAGERVEVSCFFDISGGKHQPEMTGLEGWTHLPDTRFEIGSHNFLKKKVSHTVTLEDKGRTVTCSLGEKQKSETVNIWAEPRAELTISPGSEVLLSTSVNLTCRIKNLRPANERLQLKFGAGKHRAVLHDSWLGYPTLWGTKRLLPHSCLDFSGPTVTICAGKSQLSARFEAVPGLVGKASCGVMTGKSVEKTLQITDINIWIHPHRSKAGERVEVSCFFDISGGKHQPEMTGLGTWTKLPDNETKSGGRTLLRKAAWRKVTAADNGRYVTCSMGGKQKIKYFNIRYPPIVTMRPGNREIVTVGSKITCSAEANPPPGSLLIYYQKDGDIRGARGVEKAEIKIPMDTEPGVFTVICTALNEEHSTREERSFRVRA